MPDDRPVILLVDDQPSNLKVLAAMLRTDYRVKVATRGADALVMAAQDPRPDLILLDVMMPGMDGYAVCAALKASPATERIPVIFLTAKTDAGSETAALASGAADFIHKPVNPAVARARVRLQLMLRQRARDLERANAELARHRDRLEQRVRERTAELEASEAKFRVLVEQSMVGIFIQQDGRFRYANPALARIRGCASPEDIVGHLCTDFVVPEDRERIGAIARDMQDEGWLRFRARRGDGRSTGT